MGYPFTLSLLALFVAVILIAQTAITINNYNKTSQSKDLNYYWSCFVLGLAIIAALGAMAGMFMNRGSAVAAVSTATGATSAANLQAKANALANLEKAQAEAARILK
jgi:hypothetical protein